MSDKPYTLDDFNETIERYSLKLVEKVDETGTNRGFILQEIETGDTWFEVFENGFYFAIELVEAFIQGMLTGEELRAEKTKKLAARDSEIEIPNSPVESLARATAYRGYRRKQVNRILLENVFERIAKVEWEIVEFIDTETGLISHALADRAGEHIWDIPHTDIEVAGLVINALLDGLAEGENIANREMEALLAMKQIEDHGGRLN